MTEPDHAAGPDPTRAVPTEEEVAAELAAAEEERRYPSTIGGAFYLAVLAVTGLGIGIAAFGNWRLGVRWMAGALFVAALVRLVLPRRDAGMLAVRHRLFDVLLLAVVGGLLVFLAQTIPNQPG